MLPCNLAQMSVISPKYLLQSGASFREIRANIDPSTGLLFPVGVKTPLYDFAHLKSLPRSTRKQKFAAIKAGKKTRQQFEQLKQESEVRLAPVQRQIKLSKAELKNKQDELAEIINSYQISAEVDDSEYENRIAHTINEAKKIFQEQQSHESQVRDLKSQYKGKFHGLEQEKQARDLTYPAPEQKPFALRVLDEEFNFTNDEKSLLESRVENFTSIPIATEVKAKFSRLKDYIYAKKNLKPFEENTLLLEINSDNAVVYLRNKLAQISSRYDRQTKLEQWIQIYLKSPTFNSEQAKVLNFLLKEYKGIPSSHSESLFAKAKNYPELIDVLVHLFKQTPDYSQTMILVKALRSKNHELTEKLLAIYKDESKIEDFQKHKFLNLQRYPYDEYLWTYALETDSKGFEILAKRYGKDFIERIFDFNKTEYNQKELVQSQPELLSSNTYFFLTAVKNGNLPLIKLIWAGIPEQSKKLYCKKDIYKAIRSQEKNFISFVLDIAVKNGNLEMVQGILDLMPNETLKHKLLESSLYPFSPYSDHPFSSPLKSRPFQIIYTAIETGQAAIVSNLLKNISPVEKQTIYTNSCREFLRLVAHLFRKENISNTEFEAGKNLLNDFLQNNSKSKINFLAQVLDYLVRMDPLHDIDYRNLYKWLEETSQEQKNITCSEATTKIKMIDSYPNFSEYFADEINVSNLIQSMTGEQDTHIINHARVRIPLALYDFVIKTNPTIIDKVLDHYKKIDQSLVSHIVNNIVSKIQFTANDYGQESKERIENNIKYIFDKYKDSIPLQKIISNNKFAFLCKLTNSFSPNLVNYFINQIEDIETKNSLVKIFPTYIKLSQALSLSLMMEDYPNYYRAQDFAATYAFDLANLFDGDYKAACNFIFNKFQLWQDKSLHNTLLNIRGPKELNGWEKNKWKDLIEKQIASPQGKNEPQISNMLEQAIKIQEALSKMPGRNLRTLNPYEVQALVYKTMFANAEADKDLFNICIDPHILATEEQFNKAFLVREGIRKN